MHMPDNVWMTCTYADNMWTCPDATCRENHQHRLCRKSFTWSWNETTQHCCNKFHSITSSCHSRKIVQVHTDHEEFCRWCADDVPTCGWHSRWHVIHQPNLQWNLTLVSSACHLHVICMSYAHRPHIICTRLQFPDNFQSKSRQLC